MRRFFTIFAVLFAFVGCSQDDVVTPNAPIEKPTYYASFADAEADSRTYLDENFMLLWHNDDRISLFATTYNEEYAFADATGSNSGAFNAVDKDSYVTGNAISTTYAVYPYNAANAISNSEILTIHFPAEQSYAEDSFGRGANTMVAAAQSSSSKLLPFRNAGGYMMLKLYGENKTVKSIELKGNNEEVISGAATAEAKYGYLPLITMGTEGGKSITLTCENAVELGATEAEATTFWIVVPPITFEEGFTITVTDADGGTYTKSTSKPTTINRNEIKSMSALAPTFTGETENPGIQEVPETWKIYYTATEKVEIDSWNKDTFGANIVSNEWDETTSEGVITFDGEVTSIGDNAFYDCSSLTSVTIPNSVTSIGKRAFVYCSSLTSVTIPNGVTTIGESTFFNCTSLTSITIPDGVTSIGDYAFNYCSSLTSVTIPNSVTTIGECTFSYCSSLTSVTIPNDVTTIGDGAFAYCDNLAEFKGKFATDDGLCLIVNGTLQAFAIGSGATKYTIPDSVTKIGYSAFALCDSLTSIIIPDRVTKIGGWAFSGCSSLTSVIIGNSVTSIGDYAFNYCSSLTKVYCTHTTPPSLGGYYVFRENALERKIYVPTASVEAYKSASYWSVYENSIVATNGPVNNEIWYTNGSTTVATAPYKTNVFGANIVSNTYDASKKCWVIKFDSSVTSIGSSAFESCSSLTSVTIPDSVTSIGSGAFYDCSSLTSITIPNSVTSIGSDAFSWCESLTSVHISDLSAWCKIDFESDYANPFGYAENLYLNGKLVTDIIIPSDITEIKKYAFCGCSSLTSVTIPNSVTKIGKYAFKYCSSLAAFYGKLASGDNRCLILDGVLCSFASVGLTSYTIPNGVTTIGDNALESCRSLTNVTIPNGVTTIGYRAFAYCSSLTSVTIPNSVTSIGNYAFGYCRNLRSVYCKPTTPPTGASYMFNGTASSLTIYVPRNSFDAYKSASGWSNYRSDIVGYDF